MPDTTSRLSRARKAMQSRGLDFLVVPTGDAHLSEYISERWQARAYLSGFKGSAGTLVVSTDIAGLWVDGRYHMRADSETAGTPITVFKLGRPGVPEWLDWLASEAREGHTVGIDPEAVSAATFLAMRERLEAQGVQVKAFPDLIDEAWPGRPEAEPAEVIEHPLEYAGESASSKLERLTSRLRENGATALLVTGMDEVAWLLNLRGSDVPLNPVALAYCLVGMEQVKLFAHVGKVSSELTAALPAGVELLPYDSLANHLATLPEETVLTLDPDRTNVRLYQAVEHLPLKSSTSPIQFMKSVKNSVELEGAAKAHLYDGVALTRLLHWLSVTDPTTQTELSVAQKLDEFRADLPGYRGRSFDTIVGFGPNSSVGHYKLDPVNPQRLGHDALLLIDCGAQFPFGTTDTTRTVVLGKPTPKQKRTYTTVLKSLIMLSTARFPKGTTGQRLDAIARYNIWNELWECRHGIGHGIGSYLHVHEGPQRINKENTVPFEPGMMNSCEPGVYFEGEFGVRLENVIVTTSAGEAEFGEFYWFETPTLCPFDTHLVEAGMLDRKEIEWLNSYHRRVRERLAPYLNANEREWLNGVTAAI